MAGFISRCILIASLSITGLWLLQEIYLIVGLLVAITAFSILIARGWRVEPIPRSDDFEASELARVALDFLFRCVLAIAVGAFWPGLPIILGARGDDAKGNPTPTNSR